VDLLRHAEQFGAGAGPVAVEMGTVRQRKRDMVDGLIGAHLDHYKQHAAELVMGRSPTIEEQIRANELDLGVVGRPRPGAGRRVPGRGAGGRARVDRLAWPPVGPSPRDPFRRPGVDIEHCPRLCAGPASRHRNPRSGARALAARPSPWTPREHALGQRALRSHAGTQGWPSALMPRMAVPRARLPPRRALCRSSACGYLPMVAALAGREPLPLDGRPL
jgi:hypothetical protein